MTSRSHFQGSCRLPQPSTVTLSLSRESILPSEFNNLSMVGAVWERHYTVHSLTLAKYWFSKTSPRRRTPIGGHEAVKTRDLAPAVTTPRPCGSVSTLDSFHSAMRPRRNAK